MGATLSKTPDAVSVAAMARDLWHRVAVRSEFTILGQRIEDALRQEQELPLRAPYHHLQNIVAPHYQAILSAYNECHAREFLRLLLLQMLLRKALRAESPSGLKLTASIADLQLQAFARIVREVERQPATFYRPCNDLYLKDLAIAAHRLLPGGAELLQPWSGIPRSLAVRGGLNQALRAVYCFVLRRWGFRNYCALHMDPRHLREFSPEGWHRTYLRIAEFLALNPVLRGFFGTAWFYDPAIAEFSPHLAYLREVRESGGAVNFRYGSTPGVVGNATSTSWTRRHLHEAGNYLPTAYYLVWPRDALLAWASRQGSAMPEPSRLSRR